MALRNTDTAPLAPRTLPASGSGLGHRQCSAALGIPRAHEVCQAARRYRIPVLYDPMDEVAVMELLAEKFPDDCAAQLSVIDHIARHLSGDGASTSGAPGGAGVNDRSAEQH